jgi:NlpC/P60 family
MLPAMRFFGFSAISILLSALLLLALATGAQAAPPGAGNSGTSGTAGDDMDRFLSDKGLLTQIEQAGQRVSHKASELVVTALGFLGVPYRMGGNTVESGFDCSGFVRAMFQQTVGLILPRRAEQQAAATEKIERVDLQPGDLVFFNTLKRAFSHVGIYVGEGKFIHSPKPGGEVRVENMAVSYWNHRFDGARRVNAAGDAAGGTAGRTSAGAAALAQQAATAPMSRVSLPSAPSPASLAPASGAPASTSADPFARFSTN